MAYRHFALIMYIFALDCDMYSRFNECTHMYEVMQALPVANEHLKFAFRENSKFYTFTFNYILNPKLNITNAENDHFQILNKKSLTSKKLASK